jgi:hypothetical protein
MDASIRSGTVSLIRFASREMDIGLRARIAFRSQRMRHRLATSSREIEALIPASLQRALRTASGSE